MSRSSSLSKVFGPVPSRRLGFSLGVDFMPFKTCSYDCVYCQLGTTTCKTRERKVYLPLDGILEQIKTKLETGPAPDYITLSGSGEPTLHSELGQLIDSLHQSFSVPVALLTNGSLLHLPEVREAAVKTDLLVPSLDAGFEASFLEVNRPCEGIFFEEMVEGLVATGREKGGLLWLEVFLVQGINDSEEELRTLARMVERISPDETHINTAVRPPAESFVQPVDLETMHRAAEMLGPTAKIIADFQRATRDRASVLAEKEILELLERRPCSAQDIASGLGVHVHEALKHLQHLLDQGEIDTIQRSGERFFLIPSNEEAFED